MKNLKLPLDLQARVISYLQYTQSTLDHQTELKQFFEMISPSLKNEVTRFIFGEVILKNEIFTRNDQLVDIVVYKISHEMFEPESSIITQGEQGDKLYFIAKGECEVFVKDEKKRETFVKTLLPGDHFGVRMHR